MKNIQEAGDVKGKYVLVRAGLNVPIENGEVRDTFRLRMMLPTLTYLHSKGARVIVVSHLGRSDEDTLAPVAPYLTEHLPLTFVQAIEGAEVDEARKNMQDGDVLLLENLRAGGDREESNDSEFAKLLASYADIYVNDAFDVSHREHASIVGVPKLLPSYIGLQFANEVEYLSRAFNPEHPFVVVLGGAKFATKLPVIERFLETADQIFVGGALANDFFVAREYSVGTSNVSSNIEMALKLKDNEKIVTPVDVVVKRGEERIVCKPQEVQEDDYIMDAGPATLDKIQTLVGNAGFVLWNGPLGFYEKGYTDGTLGVARMIAESNAETVVGGGDTLAAIAELDKYEDFSFVSTGGGAMLEFLSKGTLPGIEVLK